MSQQINLFNPAFARTRKPFSAGTMAWVLGVLVALAALAGAYGAHRLERVRAQASDVDAQLLIAKRRLDEVTRQYPPREKSPALAAELAEAQAQLDALRRVGEMLDRGELGNRRGFADYFRALARQHVDGVWLTAVSVNGTAVDVRGRALQPSLLPQLLSQLTHEQALRGQAYTSVAVTAPAAPKGAPQAPDAGAVKTPAASQPYVDFAITSGAAPGEARQP